jgi:hypothetical protein
VVEFDGCGSTVEPSDDDLDDFLLSKRGSLDARCRRRRAVVVWFDRS